MSELTPEAARVAAEWLCYLGWGKGGPSAALRAEADRLEAAQDDPDGFPLDQRAGDSPRPTTYEDYTSILLARLSRWIDELPANAARDPEAMTWQRVAKVAEEAGEAVAALIGWTASNPRKGQSHTVDDVVAELLDVATAALGAVEHLTGNSATSIWRLDRHIRQTVKRAGLPLAGGGQS